MKLEAARPSRGKLGILTGLAVVAGLSIMVAAPKPATAGSSFSIGISTNDFSIGYRSWQGGGYRYWTPGFYDVHRHWHDGCYTGPVIYTLPPDYQTYDGGGYYGYAHGSDPNYRIDEHRGYTEPRFEGAINDNSGYRIGEHSNYHSENDDGFRGADRGGHYGRDGNGLRGAEHSGGDYHGNGEQDR